MIRSYSVRVETIVLILRSLTHINYRSTTYLARTVYGSSNTIACACAQLSKSKLVETKKGANGGFRLIKPLSEMTVKDFLAAVPANKRLLRYTLEKISDHSLEEYLRNFN